MVRLTLISTTNLTLYLLVIYNMYLQLGVDGLRALENYNPSGNVSSSVMVLYYTNSLPEMESSS